MGQRQPSEALQSLLCVYNQQWTLLLAKEHFPHSADVTGAEAIQHRSHPQSSSRTEGIGGLPGRASCGWCPAALEVNSGLDLAQGDKWPQGREWHQIQTTQGKKVVWLLAPESEEIKAEGWWFWVKGERWTGTARLRMRRDWRWGQTFFQQSFCASDSFPSVDIGRTPRP